MTVLYSNDFEAETVGAAVPGWTSATLKTRNEGVARGSKGIAADTAGDWGHWSSWLTAQAVRTAQPLLSSGSSMGIILRRNGSNDQHFEFFYEWNGTNLRPHILRRDFGLAEDYPGTYNIPAAVNDIVHMEASAVGSTLSLRVWVNSNPRPASPSLTATNGSRPEGYPGLRRQAGAFAFVGCDDVVITDAAGGEDFFYPPAGFAGSVVLGAVAAGGSLATVMSGFTGGAALGALVAGGSLGATPGVFTLGPIMVNGVAQAGAALDWVRIYSDAGVLLYERTGGTLNGAGSTTLTTNAAPPGTPVRIDWQLSSGRRRMPRVTMG